jgi:predicted ArsR family transcriptional regulator
VSEPARQQRVADAGFATPTLLVYALAHSDQPLTARELADRVQRPSETVARRLTELRAAGLAGRQRRPTASGGRRPMEWWLAAPPEASDE